VAQISINCKRTHLGYFNTELDAAFEYDKKALELHRPLNFPVENASKQASKADNAVIVGPDAGFTKGPYKKRKRIPEEDEPMNEEPNFQGNGSRTMPHELMETILTALRRSFTFSSEAKRTCASTSRSPRMA
jgi:hypothetical protein